MHVEEKKRPRVVALIAAHNEEHELPHTLSALRDQTVPLDRILVMADNCTDRTVAVARAFGAEVVETRDNAARKAGALNQGIVVLAADGYDYLLQMDADTVVERSFVEAGVAELEGDRLLAGACARFFPRFRPGLLGALQRLEYARYDQSRRRRGWRVNVLSGTAVIFRAAALPERPWSETSLVEDYALTLELRSRGWKVRAGEHMIAHTDSMPTVKALWRQRIRWTRGTIEELVREGWKPWTRADILAHVALAATIGARLVWIAAIVLTVLSGSMFWTPIWLIPLALALGEGVLTTRRVAWRDRLLLLLVLPEELYNTLRQAWTCAAAVRAFAGREATW